MSQPRKRKDLPREQDLDTTKRVEARLAEFEQDLTAVRKEISALREELSARRGRDVGDEQIAALVTRIAEPLVERLEAVLDERFDKFIEGAKASLAVSNLTPVTGTPESIPEEAPPVKAPSDILATTEDEIIRIQPARPEFLETFSEANLPALGAVGSPGDGEETGSISVTGVAPTQSSQVWPEPREEISPARDLPPLPGHLRPRPQAAWESNGTSPKPPEVTATAAVPAIVPPAARAYVRPPGQFMGLDGTFTQSPAASASNAIAPLCEQIARKHNGHKIGERGVFAQAVTDRTQAQSISICIQDNQRVLSSIRDICGSLAPEDAASIVGRAECLTLLNLAFHANTKTRPILNSYAIDVLRTVTAIFRANPKILARDGLDISLHHAHAMMGAVLRNDYFNTLEREWRIIARSSNPSPMGEDLRAAQTNITVPESDDPADSQEAVVYATFNDVNLQLLEGTREHRALRMLVDIITRQGLTSIESRDIQASILTALKKKGGKGTRKNPNPVAQNLVNLGVLKGSSGSYSFRPEFLARLPKVIAWITAPRETALDGRIGPGNDGRPAPR